MPDRGIATAFDVLASTPATLRGLLGALSDDVTSAPADAGWSPRDVVAHVASLNSLTLVGRVRVIIEQDDPLIPDVDEQVALQSSGLRSRPLAEVLDAFARERADAVEWLRGLAPEALARTGRHATVGRLSAAEVIHHKAWHDLLHVEQICRMLAIPLDAGSGPMRKFH